MLWCSLGQRPLPMARAGLHFAWPRLAGLPMPVGILGELASGSRSVFDALRGRRHDG
nr:hypothetical protein [Deltaproteobacteria bacterium]